MRVGTLLISDGHEVGSWKSNLEVELYSWARFFYFVKHEELKQM